MMQEGGKEVDKVRLFRPRYSSYLLRKQRRPCQTTTSRSIQALGAKMEEGMLLLRSSRLGGKVYAESGALPSLNLSTL